MSRGSSLLFIALACLAMGASCEHVTSSRIDIARLETFLGAYLWRAYREDDPPVRLTYQVAATDLDGDNIDELLVYLTSSCGNGGCNLLILTPRGNSYRVVTNATIVKLPVRVLDTRSNGWRNLTVWVQGGGILEGYEAELPYDGDSYPSNPSMPPARKLQGTVSGEILFDDRHFDTHHRETLIGKPVVFVQLDRFLNAHYWRAHHEGRPPTYLRYIAAAADLNGDDVDELLVYVGGRAFFGTGCCNLLILARQADSYRVVTETSMVRMPIRILDAQSHGWRNLSAWVQGSGLFSGYETELAFDGETYPANLSRPPAPRLQGLASGEVVFDRARLYSPHGLLRLHDPGRSRADRRPVPARKP